MASLVDKLISFLLCGAGVFSEDEIFLVRHTALFGPLVAWLRVASNAYVMLGSLPASLQDHTYLESFVALLFGRCLKNGIGV